MGFDASDALLRSLHDHNPWWSEGLEAFDLPDRHKSDFYHLARPTEPGSQFEDQPMLALVGRRGAGKSTLLKQFVEQRIAAGDPPEQFCYLPFDADPLTQLQSDEQLLRAVRYYERRILGRIDAAGPEFLMIDDVHRIEHPNKPDIEGWATPVTDLLAESTDRHIVVTASAERQIGRELERVGLPTEQYDAQPILPEKFRDYLFTVEPALEEGPTRISPTSLRRGDGSVPAAIDSGSVEALVKELHSKHDQVAEHARRIQSLIVDYLAMGGTIGFEYGGTIDSAAELESSIYQGLREDVRDALYQDVPGFESLQTIDDLERLCALAARTGGREAVAFAELVDLFDVDRRTIVDSYLPALSALFILDGVTEYDNRRPRSVRLYLRDTGLATALAGGDPETVLTDVDRETELAHVAAFDHTMRLEYGINAEHGRDIAPNVQYWRGSPGLVDFVFTVGETPVPVGLAYHQRHVDETKQAIEEFMAAYSAPVGILVSGETTAEEPPVAAVDDDIVRLPYWLYLLVC